MPAQRRGDLPNGALAAEVQNDRGLAPVPPQRTQKVAQGHVLMLKELELIGSECIKNFIDAKLKRHLDRIDKCIEEALEVFDRSDRYEESNEKQDLVAHTQDAMEVLKAGEADYAALRQKLKVHKRSRSA